MTRRTTTGLRCALAGLGVALVVAVVPARAVGGTYKVANCRADPSTYSTAAFSRFASRGMEVSLACGPNAVGMMSIGNAKRKGTVKGKSLAVFVLDAPPGTQFVNFWWAGEARRTDCRYAVQMWAESPDAKTVPIVNLRANERCPKAPKTRDLTPRRRSLPSQFMQVTKERGYPQVKGATRIVQRVICRGGGGRDSCSSMGTNRFSTHRATVEVEDTQPPTATVLASPSAGAWLSGEFSLKYDAGDNIGVRSAQAIVADRAIGTFARECAFAEPEKTFAAPLPCPNGPREIKLDARRIGEGIHQLVVRAFDPAGNYGDAPVTIQVDSESPPRVDVQVEGGQDWRSRNDFAVSWVNPPEPDRAPIVGAIYRLCPVAGGACTQGEQAGADLSRVSIPAPGPGEWKVELWRRDAAGNADEKMASVPVTLRLDPDPPVLGFEAPSPSDPTLVAVKASDAISGVAEGSIEMSLAGSGIWRTLPVGREGERLFARLDDAALAPGRYEFRARASDLARNEASTGLRLDGQPMVLDLPVRVVSSLQNAFERQRTIRSRRGKDRHVVVQTQSARVLFGEAAQVAGRLVNSAGIGIAGAEIQVLATTPLAPEQLEGVVQTDAEGRYRYTAAGTMNRTLRFVYAGSPVVLPAERRLSMTVPASTALGVDRARLRNGQAVTFSGPVRTLPTPPGGKLVEMQVRLPGRWETFRTIRSDDAGQWSVRYRFRRTSGVQYYRFRARLPAEGGYPYTAAVSRVMTVRVRGAR